MKPINIDENCKFLKDIDSNPEVTIDATNNLLN